MSVSFPPDVSMVGFNVDEGPKLGEIEGATEDEPVGTRLSVGTFVVLFADIVGTRLGASDIVVVGLADDVPLSDVGIFDGI